MRNAFLAALALSAGLATGAAAQDFPRKPVTIVVPAAAGTGADIVARLLGQKLAEAWGQPVVVDNKAGASGTTGAALVARAAPDGHTLCMCFANHTVSPSVQANVPFDILKDFKPVIRTAVAPMAIVAHPSFAPNTLPQLMALAKSRGDANPIFFGSPGTGSINGLSLELLKLRAGVRMTHTPFKSNAQMLTDVVGNQLPIAAATIASALPQIQAGKLKALAVTSSVRSSALPDVPTVAEAGLAGYDVSAWNGLLAPAGTPDDIVNRIHASVTKIAGTPEFKQTLHAQGMEPALLGPKQFHDYMAAEVKQWAQVVKAADIKGE
ncbi:MAG TPA: tripartite tricarboxylate transporter substrate binding protein [Ramlibacter sp.]|nr:tripartite tricarboxylate transporter substrate binding protein [Ramlibacter sp.]